MAKPLFLFQETIQHLRQEIADILHLSYLNKQSIICLNQNPKVPFHQVQNNLNDQKNSMTKKPRLLTSQNSLKKLRQKQFEQKFAQISSHFQKRSYNHLNYLIVKQIQWQQQSVRTDRLNEYEDRIYDQRRLISDKQVFCENLLRPKKKRLQSTTPQDYQQQRARQKIAQQAVKLNLLQQETKILVAFKENILQSDQKIYKSLSDTMIINRQIQMYEKDKMKNLQKTNVYPQEIVENTANNLTLDKSQKIIEEEQYYNNLEKNNQNTDLKKLQMEYPPSSEQGVERKKAEILKDKISKKQENVQLNIKLVNLLSKIEQSTILQEKRKVSLQQIQQLLHKIQQKKINNAQKYRNLKEAIKQNSQMQLHLNKFRNIEALRRKI